MGKPSGESQKAFLLTWPDATDAIRLATIEGKPRRRTEGQVEVAPCSNGLLRQDRTAANSPRARAAYAAPCVVAVPTRASPWSFVQTASRTPAGASARETGPRAAACASAGAARSRRRYRGRKPACSRFSLAAGCPPPACRRGLLRCRGRVRDVRGGVVGGMARVAGRGGALAPGCHGWSATTGMRRLDQRLDVAQKVALLGSRRTRSRRRSRPARAVRPIRCT